MAVLPWLESERAGLRSGVDVAWWSFLLEVDGRFYRLLGVELRADGEHRVLAYRWQEPGEHEIIRRPVRYLPLT